MDTIYTKSQELSEQLEIAAGVTAGGTMAVEVTRGKEIDRAEKLGLDRVVWATDGSIGWWPALVVDATETQKEADEWIYE
eukprot:SAG31_NODE_2803_length_5072_cov_3.559421_5_plen_80_part_00